LITDQGFITQSWVVFHFNSLTVNFDSSKAIVFYNDVSLRNSPVSGEDAMFPIHYSTEVLFALPLLGFLVARFFKLHSLVAIGPAAQHRSMLIPRVDTVRRPLCMVSDRRMFVPVVKRIPETNTNQVIRLIPERRRNTGELCYYGIDRRALRLTF